MGRSRIKAEARIYAAAPRWVGLEEIERDEDRVWFKTRTGRVSIALKDVEKWEVKQRKKRR